jgi:aminocarboxymuconate-semialdehyde decarboxylase
MNIDVHAHFLPDTLIDYIAQNPESTGRKIEHDGSEAFLVSEKLKMKQKIQAGYYDHSIRSEFMMNKNIDKMVLSLTPSLYNYHIDKDVCLEMCIISNDWVAEQARQKPEELAAMMTLPMQDQTLTLKELERAHTRLGINAVEIEPIILGKTLDEEEFYPFFEYCESNGVLIYLHPTPILDVKDLPLKKYYNMNLLGTCLETTVGLDHMILGGVFEKFGRLSVLASHGGGFLPYQIGRLDHGFAVRPEVKKNIKQNPGDYMRKNVYFDTITHSPEALRFLISSVGADHVLMGTDYPYDMGDLDPVKHVREAELKSSDEQLVLWKNVETLLRLDCVSKA